MEEKKSIKVSLGTVVCLFIIMLLIIGLVGMYLYYNQDNSNNVADKDSKVEIKELEKNESNNVLDVESNQNKENEKVSQSEKDETDTKKTIPTSDLVTLYYDVNNEGADVFYAYIEDGYLYYFNENVRADGVAEGAFDFTSVFRSNMAEYDGIKKYEGLSNIKKMKIYNTGTGVNPVVFLITESGEVYSISIYTESELNAKIYEGLKDYKVEDILSHTGEMYSVFEVLLKDGSTKTVTVN